METNNQESKYNPLKDGAFWVAFFLGGGPVIIKAAYHGLLSHPAVMTNIVLLVAWLGWIIWQKGKKGSLIKGFFVALAITAVAFFIIGTNEQKRVDAEIKAEVEKMEKEVLEPMIQELLEKHRAR